MKKASSKLLLLDVNVLIGIAWPRAHNNAVLVTFDRRLESIAGRTARVRVLG